MRPNILSKKKKAARGFFISLAQVITISIVILGIIGGLVMARVNFFAESQTLMDKRVADQGVQIATLTQGYASLCTQLARIEAGVEEIRKSQLDYYKSRRVGRGE